MIGKYVIAREDKAGVFFGILKEKTPNTVILTNVRKLYYWQGANTVEDLATSGVKFPENSKFTVVVKEMEIKTPDQMLICTDDSIKSLKNVKVWKA